MSTSNLEKKFIKFQLQIPPFTIEEIQYLINKERSESDKMSITEIEHYLRETKERAKLQREINDKKARRKASMLITDMNTLISDLRDMITELHGEEGNTRTMVQAIKELRLTIMDIARLAGELQKQQNAEISNYYIPINRIEEYVQKRIATLAKKKAEKNPEKVQEKPRKKPQK